MNLDGLLSESMETGEFKLAYSIFWAMQKKLVTGADRFEDFILLDLDHDEIKKLQEQNLLGLKLVNLYSSKLESNQFIFIFAESEIAAKLYYKSLYGASLKSMSDASIKMDMEMWCADEGYMTFREMKDKTLSFPSIALVYEKENKSASQIEHEYFRMFGKKLMTNEEKQTELESGDTLFY